MSAEYKENIFRGHMIKGNLIEAARYRKQFPEHAEYAWRYVSLFEKEQYLVFEEDAYLNEILVFYQQYYRDIFFLKREAGEAAERLRERFLDFFKLENRDMELEQIEENEVREAFVKRGFHFLGGKTGGYFGPYIWKTTEVKQYNVELPSGATEYTVKLLDGFISKSWLHFISFGEIGTGGWIGKDGIIHCVKEAYNLESESFTVSLLKHEAQHAADLAADKNMPSEELEYRAKLVELIYSYERNLLQNFVYDADSAKKENGHAMASCRIVKGFEEKLHIGCQELALLKPETIRATAKELFAESDQGATWK